MTAGDIMNKVAALLNDVALTNFTYVYQLPYLNMALKELEESFALNNIPVTNKTSVAINVPAGTTEIGFQANPATVIPTLPVDLIEIEKVWERLEGTEPWREMTKLRFLPQYMEGTLVSAFVWWVWEDQKIRVLESNQDNDIKLDYISTLFPEVKDQDDPLTVLTCRSFLQYRTAALCALYIGEDANRAEGLNIQAQLAIDRTLGISVKGGQVIKTRRRPFRAGYRARGIIT